MTDDGRAAEVEQLPWLEAVDDEEGGSTVSARKMIAALAVVLVAALLIGGSFYWLGNRSAGSSGEPELIMAEPGPFKVKPSDPGGLDVTGESETAYATSAGADPDSRLDLDALPEEPVARPAPPPAKPATPAPVAGQSTTAPVRTVEVEQKPEPDSSAAAGSVVQLGAYTSAAQAQRGWDALSARFPSVAAMTKLIVPYSGGYRLRAGAASADEARKTCQALKVAGENCFQVR